MGLLKRRSPLLGTLLLFLGYFGLAILLTWPLFARLTTALPAGTDTLVHYWNNWWVGQALGDGRSPYFTELLFHPDGLSLVYHNFAWLHILEWLALRPLAGEIAAYNLIFLFNLALCGLAAYWLAFELVGDRRAAALAGLIYQAWPYRLTQTSHPNLVSTWAIPLFLLFLTRALKRRRWSDTVLAGLCLALVGYVRWQLLIPTALIAALYLLFQLPGKINRRMLALLALSGAVALLALLPPVLLLANEWRENPAELVIESELALQTDLLAYLTPAGANPFLGRLTEPLYESYYAGRGSRGVFSPFIGFVALALAVVGLWKAPGRGKWAWVAIALFLILLALGPTLRLNGQLWPAVPMPYRLAQRLPIVPLLREPDRFNMFLALPVAMLAAYGACYLLSRKTRLRPALWLGAIGLLVLLEYLAIPLPTQPTAIPPLFAEMAGEEGDFAVLNVPVDPFKSKPYMFWQTEHGRPILQGHASRYPAGAFDYLEGQPWLRAMMAFDELPPPQEDLSAQMAALARDGVRYIVLDKEQIPPEFLPKWRHYLAASPRYEDERVAVYATQPQAREDFALEALLSGGLGVIDARLSTTCLSPDSALGLDVTWGALAPLDEIPSIELALIPAGGGDGTKETFPIGDWPAEEWRENAIFHGRYSWQPPQLPPGRYQLQLSALDPDGEVTGEPVALGELALQDDLCSYPAPAGATGANVVFGDLFRLVAYQLRQSGDALDLTLHWRPELRTSLDYKVFVHVFDPASGVPLAQHDAMPRNWGYPTSLWGLDELIADDVSISLEGLPPGSYGVALGIYEPASGERLVPRDAAGNVFEDGRLVLPDVVERR
jgi:hypothetical protein